jgi:cytochrome oxidase Cu insertion factor (SCO1/SenC/PrrC family)
MLSLAGGGAVRKMSIALLLTCFLLTAVAQAQKVSSPSAPEVKIGDLAPDFTMVDQKGKPRSLHDYKGKKNVALAFYVWAFSSD